MTDSAFANPAHDTARCFRTILDAIAHPGRIMPFTPPLQAPADLGDAAAAIALTLCDFQTAIWLDTPFQRPEIMQYLRFHTGAPAVETPGEADFVFVDGRHGLPDLSSLKRGSHAYPDRSASVVMRMESLDDDGPLSLSGPGIKSPRRFGPTPLDWSFWAFMARCNANYPLGMDVFLVTGNSIAAIPRSTRIQLTGAA